MFRSLIPGLCMFALSACGASSPAPVVANETTNDTFDAAFADDHLYFPLQAGRSWSYFGEEDGHRVQEEVSVAPGLEVIDGVRCFVLVQDRLLDDELVETTFQWFSGASDGSVWLFGEQSLHPLTHEPLAEDSWLAGRDGARPVRWLPAQPEPGDALTLALPHGDELVLVLSLDGEASVPAGTFGNCLVVAESSGEETDLILYAPGIGRVQESSPGTTLRLVERR